MRKLRHLIEAILLYPIYGILWIMPMPLSSWIIGKFFRIVGIILPVNHVAEVNMKFAFPEATDSERKKYISDHWENLGRTVGEIPHMASLTGEKYKQYVSVKNAHYIDEAISKSKHVIMVAAHIGNWELAARSGQESGLDIAVVYRHVNNLYLDNLLRYSRRNSHDGLFRKDQAARGLTKKLKDGGNIAMMIDQKFNQGIEVPLFGKPCMTAPAAADMAIKYNIPIIANQVVRKQGCQFEVVVHPPIYPEGKTTEQIMLEINQMLETWIKENPSQWFWLHRRWDKSNY